MEKSDLLNISTDIASALATNKPVVALESTVIAHGLPRPTNLELAQRLETDLRTASVSPATIGIIGGELTVGLNHEQIRLLAEDSSVKKISTRDVPVAIARGWNGATTVASTSWIAHRAGIQVFATGGIGGVHRGDSGDVSHDLVALANTPIAVVSAGAKAILDLPRTLEALETLGVLVVGYRTTDLPAFYARTSGLALEHRCDDATALAAICRARWALDQGGVLVCNPIPEVAALTLDAAIATALADAAAAGVTGKKLTPFLLARIAAVTSGASITANRALAIHDAEVAAELAVALDSAARDDRTR